MVKLWPYLCHDDGIAAMFLAWSSWLIPSFFKKIQFFNQVCLRQLLPYEVYGSIDCRWRLLRLQAAEHATLYAAEFFVHSDCIYIIFSSIFIILKENIPLNAVRFLYVYLPICRAKWTEADSKFAVFYSQFCSKFVAERDWSNKGSRISAKFEAFCKKRCILLKKTGTFWKSVQVANLLKITYLVIIILQNVISTLLVAFFVKKVGNFWVLRIRNFEKKECFLKFIWKKDALILLER